MTPSCPVRRSPFASRSLAQHLARGALAVALAVAASRFGDRSALILPAALVGAAALMRGCPTCWLVGLFGTLADRTAHGEHARDGHAAVQHGSVQHATVEHVHPDRIGPRAPAA